MLQKFDERNRDLIVNVGGRLSHRDEAGVSPFDSVVQGGDAVWEGLRLTDGRIFALEEHLARLRRSAHALAFDSVPTQESMIAEIRRTLAANSMRTGVHIRLTLTRGVKLTSGMDPRLNVAGPTLIVLAEFKDPVYDLSGIRLITSSVRRHAPDSLDPKIHHNNLLTSIMAKIEANVAGADDAVMLDSRGFIAETNATHLFMVLPQAGEGASGGAGPVGRAGAVGADRSGDRAGGSAPARSPLSDVTLATPTTVACPEGITRATVLGLAASEGIATSEADYTLPQLYNASEVFVTGTMGGLAPVVSVDGRSIGDGAIGPVTKHLTGLYGNLTATTGTTVA
ncbi:MAG TPA: aminotransferase class IV [Trebonia sp.]